MKKLILMAYVACMLSVFASAQTYQLKYPKVVLKADSLKLIGNAVVITDKAGKQIINVNGIDRTAGRVLTTDVDGVGRFVTPGVDSATQNLLNAKVDKVAGKSLISDGEIIRFNNLAKGDISQIILGNGTLAPINVVGGGVRTDNVYGGGENVYEVGNSFENGYLGAFGNVAIGLYSMQKSEDVFNNTAVGNQTLKNLNTIKNNLDQYPMNNTAIGFNAGIGYTGSESYNTILGAHPGTPGDMNRVVLSDGAGNVIIDANGLDKTPNLFLIKDANGVGKFTEFKDCVKHNNEYGAVYQPSVSFIKPNAIMNTSVALGTGTLLQAENSEGNTAIGAYAMSSALITYLNTAVGAGALSNCQGNYNTAIGANAGIDYNANESYNTIIGNYGGGAGENNNVVLADGVGNLVIKIDATNRSKGRILVTDENGVGGYTTLLATAPISATDTGAAGEIRVTPSYVYYCVATNAWVRSALTTW